jgi:electron transfer flavoprotein beta subunit
VRIAVCITEVLDPDRVAELAAAGFLRMDPATGRPDAAHIAPVMNETDRQALAKAVAVAARLDPPAEVLALTAGAARPAELCNEAFQTGAGAACHVDADLAGADVATVAALLAAALRQAGGAELVLAGAQASGGDGGAVGAALAAELDVPCFTGVRDFSLDADGVLRVAQSDGGAERELQLRPPALLCVYDETWKPPVLNPRHLIAARDRTATTCDLGALGVDGTGAGRRVETLAVEVPALPSRCEQIDTADVDAAAGELLSRLRAQGVL